VKIALVIGAPVTHSGHGVVSQALTWKKGLEDKGHSVTLVNNWITQDWKSFDIIQFFMYSEYVADYIDAVAPENKNIVFAPVIDPNFSINAMRGISHWGCAKLKLFNRYYRIRKIKNLVSKFLVRSDFEAMYVEKGWGVEKNKIVKVPLSFNFFSNETSVVPREKFCFHASYLADERKNVRRLIEAAKKYKFPLKLAGKLRNQQETNKVFSWIGDAKNIEYLGFLPQEDLLEYYKKAKVFALPSTNEGVGIVALDAAAMGCDIVITKLGGPKEYYGNYATIVDPYDVDEIGKSILSFLEGKTFQPELQKYMHENFSLENTIQRLVNVYVQL